MTATVLINSNMSINEIIEKINTKLSDPSGVKVFISTDKFSNTMIDEIIERVKVVFGHCTSIKGPRQIEINIF